MRLAIVGGGIAGLSTAYYAQKATHEAGLDVQITLIERETSLGGKITTEITDGFIIEGGPDSFITQKPWALQLCRELGLEDRVMGTNQAQRHVYVLRKGKLRKMPDGLMLIVPTRFMPFLTSDLLSLPGKIRMGMDLFIKRRTSDSDESLAHFIQRRLGTEALEVLAEPLMAGIHVADAETLSLKATFPRFVDIERQYGSLTRGMIAAKKAAAAHQNGVTTFMTLQNGLQELVNALEKAIEGNILTGRSVTGLKSEGKEYTLSLDDGSRLEADAVVLATPAYISASLLQETHPRLAAMLNSIRYVSTATVSLGYKAEDFEHPLNGYGFVIARTEPTRILACTWTSTKFTHRAAPGTVLLRAFIGGPRHEETVELDDDGLVTLVREELHKIMDISAVPTVVRVFRWFRANPQYDVGHLERVDELDSLCPPGLYLTGSAYRGVGIPDCVRQGQLAAQQVIEHLSLLVQHKEGKNA